MSKKGTVPVYYWDANTFINVIQGTEPDGGNILRSCVRDVTDGRLRLATSALSIAEVVKPRRTKGRLSPEDEAKVTNVFKSSSIMVHDVTQLIAERARQLQWVAGAALKPADAIHLATAEYAGVERFETYDDNLTSVAQKVPPEAWNHRFDIGHPQKSNYELDL